MWQKIALCVLLMVCLCAGGMAGAVTLAPEEVEDARVSLLLKQAALDISLLSSGAYEDFSHILEDMGRGKNQGILAHLPQPDGSWKPDLQTVSAYPFILRWIYANENTSQGVAQGNARAMHQGTCEMIL